MDIVREDSSNGASAVGLPLDSAPSTRVPTPLEVDGPSKHPPAEAASVRGAAGLAPPITSQVSHLEAEDEEEDVYRWPEVSLDPLNFVTDRLGSTRSHIPIVAAPVPCTLPCTSNHKS